MSSGESASTGRLPDRARFKPWAAATRPATDAHGTVQGMRLSVVATAAAGIAMVGACRAPTQARLVLTTDIDCALRPSFAAFVERTPAAAERRVTPQIVAARCTPDGYVGETYLLPADDGELTLGLRAVAAPQSTLDSCSRATGYAGCIVARRRLSFIDGQTIVLRVALLSNCNGTPCDEQSTCVRARQCRSSSVDANQCLDERAAACVLEDTSASGRDGGSVTEGGAIDARASADATSDSGGTGATLGDTRAAYVACPAIASCYMQSCCIARVGGGAACRTTGCSTNDEVTVECDGPEECGVNYCCRFSGASANQACYPLRCENNGAGSRTVCHVSEDCPPSYTCAPESGSPYGLCTP